MPKDSQKGMRSGLVMGSANQRNQKALEAAGMQAEGKKPFRTGIKAVDKLLKSAQAAGSVADRGKRNK